MTKIRLPAGCTLKSMVIISPNHNQICKSVFLNSNQLYSCTYKVLNEKAKPPIIFSDTITLASSRHSYNTRFAAQCNLCRPNARTNYGTQTFLFTSWKIWETIDNEIKQSKSISIFRKNYSKSLLFSQTHG